MTTATRPYVNVLTQPLMDIHRACEDPEIRALLEAELATRKKARAYLASLPAQEQAEAREDAQVQAEARRLSHEDRQHARLVEFGFSPDEAEEILVDFALMREEDVFGYRAEHGCTYKEAQRALGVVPQKDYLHVLAQLG